jgi:hypothetical protein
VLFGCTYQYAVTGYNFCIPYIEYNSTTYVQYTQCGEYLLRQGLLEHIGIVQHAPSRHICERVSLRISNGTSSSSIVGKVLKVAVLNGVARILTVSGWHQHGIHLRGELRFPCWKSSEKPESNFKGQTCRNTPPRIFNSSQCESRNDAPASSLCGL